MLSSFSIQLDRLLKVGNQLALDLVLVLHYAERAAFASETAAFEGREEQLLFFAVMIAIGKSRDKLNDLQERVSRHPISALDPHAHSIESA